MHGFSLARDNCGSCIKMGGRVIFGRKTENRQQNKQKYDWNMSEHKM